MKKYAWLFVLAAGMLWGTMGIFVRRYNAAGMESPDIVFVRAFTTVLCMAVILAVYNPKLFCIHLRDVWCFLGTGILSIVFFNFCYFKTIQLTSMSVAAVLLYTAPAIVMVLSRLLFGERMTCRRILSLVITILGCIFVTGVIGDADSLSLDGILVGLGAGLGYALYSIFSRYAIERGYHTFTISFYTFLIAAVGILPLVDLTKTLHVCVSGMSMLGFSFVFGLISTVLPYVLYTLGLCYTENGTASILASIEPVTATFLGIVLYGEQVSAGGIAGVLLILAAIGLCSGK